MVKPTTKKQAQKPEIKDSKSKSLKPNGGNPVNKKTTVKKNKKPLNNKKKVDPTTGLEEGVDGVIEYEDLGKMDDWDWNEASGTNQVISDDAGGFLCLEEISDIEIEYEGDDTIGKVAKFKRVKKDRKAGKKAQPEKPFSIEEMSGFYDVDTFNEDTVAKQAENSVEEVNDENKIVSGDIDNTTDDIDNVDMEVDDVMTEDELAKEVSKKKKTELTEKKKADKEKEKLMKEMKKIDERLEQLLSSRDQINKKIEQKETYEKTPLAEGEVKPLNKRERLLAKKKAEAEAKLKAEAESKEEEESAESDQEESNNKTKKIHSLTYADVDQSVDVSAWDGLKLSEPVINALKYNQFTSPTPIQKNTLPLALEGRDIIGSAETGSGKTLAFGIPMINYLSTHDRVGLTGLVLTPTRELAIQVRDHIEKMAAFSNIRVIAIVGGMSEQKQQRQLKKNKPDIIVATPGRLWELFSENETYMDLLKHIKFLVLDEADRMLERGRFEELTSLMNSISKKKQDTTEWPEELDKDGAVKRLLPQDLGVHQTFIYTATLSKDYRFNVKAKKRKLNKQQTGTMEDLLNRIEFADKDPALVDMSSENVVASRLLEAKIDCIHTDKDLYVYYFVTRYPGRTIVFVNSIDAIRRLVPIFKLLKVEVLGLHAQMQQKQRLKSLERFKSNPKAILVASDVAARGLDIPLVEHVIHYQLPRSGEIYVHRSGRTARANRDGVSLLLCGPDEMRIYQKLCQTLRKNQDYPNFPVDLSTLKAMTERVKLAADIDNIQHQESKQVHEVNWMRNMATEMDVEFDEETMQGKGYQKSSEDLQKEKQKAVSLKFKLENMLKQPILPAGASRKFLTGGIVSDFVDRLLKGDTHETLPGSSNTRAVEDLNSSKKRKKPTATTATTTD